MALDQTQPFRQALSINNHRRKEAKRGKQGQQYHQETLTINSSTNIQKGAACSCAAASAPLFLLFGGVFFSSGWEERVRYRR